MEDNTTAQLISRASATLGIFVLDSIDKIMIWLLVMFLVVLADFVAGTRKSLLMGEKFSFSSAVRRTLGKMVTYFSVVVMVVMLNKASGEGYTIDVWAIWFICFIEGCSIVSNLLKPKGYNFNVAKAIGILLKKLFSIDKEDSEGLIRKDNESDGAE